MVTQVIQCQDCGHHEITNRKNTKRCGICRLLTNMLYVQNRTRKCWLCETPFAPIARDDRACGNCAPVFQSQPHGTCGACKNTGPLVLEGLALCMHCARDPKQRAGIVKSLRRKQEFRRENPDDPIVLDIVNDEVEF